MTDTERKVHVFFDRYAAALLARDEDAIGRLYAVPSLVLFPGNAVAVSSERQTAEFFASSWPQYEGVREARPTIAIMAEAPASVWADVRWTYDGTERERFCYQLVDDGAGGYRVAVLTPM